jgi:catechol 2,3-dioxygenase-like lactoylglutathione lyase family enzyme
MKPQVSILTLGVRDMNRAEQFYSEGLGWPILQEHGTSVAFALGDGSSAPGLYPWEALAGDAGVAADGSGKIAKPAERQPWSGSSGYFTDPDGYLWKVAAGGGEQFAAE